MRIHSSDLPTGDSSLDYVCEVCDEYVGFIAAVRDGRVRHPWDIPEGEQGLWQIVKTWSW